MTTTRILMTVNQAWSCDKSSDKSNDKFEYVRPLAPTTLAASVAAVAARELRESAATREQTLQHLRTWLMQNEDVMNVRLDDTFLLRFLRLKKYSLPMAQQTLLKYLSLRKYYPDISVALDCEEASLKEIINAGYIMISPVRDSHGRKVIVYDIGKLNAGKFTCWQQARAHVLVYESLLEEQENQVLGFTHVGDGGGACPAHVTAWNPIHFARLMKWGEQSLPMRHKEVHLINMPSSVKFVLDYACSKLSPKIVNRLQIHSSEKTLHKKVDVACLPTTYGGRIPVEEMKTYTSQVLTSQRSRVLGLDFMQILSTKGIQSSRSKPTSNDVTSVAGSFRKLDID